MGDSILYVTRSTDKKKILFFNDKSYHLQVDEDLRQLWRGCTVEGVDERKINEYLTKQGINSMKDIDHVAAVSTCFFSVVTTFSRVSLNYAIFCEETKTCLIFCATITLNF